MPSDDVTTRTEYRVVDKNGTDWTHACLPSEDPRSHVVRADRAYPSFAPHRVQQRTVTTTRWEDVTGDE